MNEDVRRFMRSLVREQLRLFSIRPMAPPALLARVVRWYWGTVVRELGLHLAAAAVLTSLGADLARRRVGVRWGRVGAISGIFALFAGRHAWQAHRSIEAIDEALEDIEGDRRARGVPISHLAIPPLMFGHKGVRRERGLVYSEVDGVRLRLDVYRSASDPAPSEGPAGAFAAGGMARPAVIQVHGGGWLSGSRFEQGIPLLNHLAGQGWVGFNIDYRLSPQHTWPAHIVDVKRAIAWVRENHLRFGIDPDRIAITGGSAGGHLTALAGLTINDPEFQPGFEDADTTVAAAVPFYGVYDLTDAEGFYYPEIRDWVFETIVFKKLYADDPDLFRRASPAERVHADAPPFLVIHGEHDSLVPVEDARRFAARLDQVSGQLTRYVELPGAEHAFDLWPSERSAAIAEAIGRFLAATVPGPGGAEAVDEPTPTASQR